VYTFEINSLLEYCILGRGAARVGMLELPNFTAPRARKLATARPSVLTVSFRAVTAVLRHEAAMPGAVQSSATVREAAHPRVASSEHAG
jgi:hypothetical protein